MTDGRQYQAGEKTEDALAALDRILLRGDNAKCGDFQIVRKALTASGVPEEDAAHDKGKAEGIRAGWNAGYAQGHNDANRDRGHEQLYTPPNEDILQAAEAMKREALASAPAEKHAEREIARIYFEVAAEALGEDEVRRRRDERIAAAPTDDGFGRVDRAFAQEAFDSAQRADQDALNGKAPNQWDTVKAMGGCQRLLALITDAPTDGRE